MKTAFATPLLQNHNLQWYELLYVLVLLAYDTITLYIFVLSYFSAYLPENSFYAWEKATRKVSLDRDWRYLVDLASVENAILVVSFTNAIDKQAS